MDISALYYTAKSLIAHYSFNNVFENIMLLPKWYKDQNWNTLSVQELPKDALLSIVINDLNRNKIALEGSVTRSRLSYLGANGYVGSELVSRLEQFMRDAPIHGDHFNIASLTNIATHCTNLWNNAHATTKLCEKLNIQPWQPKRNSYTLLIRYPDIDIQTYTSDIHKFLGVFDNLLSSAEEISGLPPQQTHLVSIDEGSVNLELSVEFTNWAAHGIPIAVFINLVLKAAMDRFEQSLRIANALKELGKQSDESFANHICQSMEQELDSKINERINEAMPQVLERITDGSRKSEISNMPYSYSKKIAAKLAAGCQVEPMINKPVASKDLKDAKTEDASLRSFDANLLDTAQLAANLEQTRKLQLDDLPLLADIIEGRNASR